MAPTPYRIWLLKSWPLLPLILRITLLLKKLIPIHDIIPFNFSQSVHGQNPVQEFFPNGLYGQNIPSPQDFLGVPVGERPLRYQEILRYFEELDKSSERAQLVTFGETFEGRDLHYLIITSEKNMENLPQIRLA